MFHLSIFFNVKNLILIIEDFFLSFIYKSHIQFFGLNRYDDLISWFQYGNNDSSCAEKEIYLKVNKK